MIITVLILYYLSFLNIRFIVPGSRGCIVGNFRLYHQILFHPCEALCKYLRGNVGIVRTVEQMVWCGDGEHHAKTTATFNRFIGIALFEILLEEVS